MVSIATLFAKLCNPSNTTVSNYDDCSPVVTFATAAPPTALDRCLAPCNVALASFDGSQTPRLNSNNPMRLNICGVCTITVGSVTQPLMLLF